LIINFKITKWKKGDSPFLKKLIKPFNQIGKIIADMAYSGKKNANYVAKKKGAFFSPFKRNADPKGLNTWSYLYKLWNIFPSLCKAIYNQRSRVETVFSILKEKLGLVTSLPRSDTGYLAHYIHCIFGYIIRKSFRN
jgi:hypothetical protein